MKSEVDPHGPQNGIIWDLVKIPSDDMHFIEHFIPSELCQTHDELNVRIQSLKKTEPTELHLRSRQSFLWLEDKTVQVIFRAINPPEIHSWRYLKKKRGICSTEKDEWNTHIMISRYHSTILAPCLWWIQPFSCREGGGGGGRLNKNDKFLHSCQAT